MRDIHRLATQVNGKDAVLGFIAVDFLRLLDRRKDNTWRTKLDIDVNT